MIRLGRSRMVLFQQAGHVDRVVRAQRHSFRRTLISAVSSRITSLWLGNTLASSPMISLARVVLQDRSRQKRFPRHVRLRPGRRDPRLGRPSRSSKPCSFRLEHQWKRVAGRLPRHGAGACDDRRGGDPSAFGPDQDCRRVSKKRDRQGAAGRDLDPVNDPGPVARGTS